ncbi:hypothetical protein PR001_g34097, partial [Phytophthora rubi]
GLISRPSTSYRGGFCMGSTFPNPPRLKFPAAADCSFPPSPSGAAAPSGVLVFLLGLPARLSCLAMPASSPTLWP